MPLPSSLIGNTWTIQTARAIVPILVWCAQHRQTITYKHLDDELVRRGLGHTVHAALYGRAAGTLGDALAETEAELGLNFPPLNILVVNKNTRRPGNGCAAYFNRYTKKGKPFDSLTWDEQGAVVSYATGDIFNCRNWDSLLRHYGMAPLAISVLPEVAGLNDEAIVPPVDGFSNEGESEDHKALKEYVLRNPSLVIQGSTKGWVGTVEEKLPSGDCVDIVFRNGTSVLAIEVKSHISLDPDLSRGIFQCVKYQAVALAWQRSLLEIPNARSVLVIQRELPNVLAELADRLSIEVFVVPKEVCSAKHRQSALASMDNQTL